MRYLFCFFVLLLPLALLGQPIQRGLVAPEYLEALLKERIDSLRAEKGLDPLVRDSALEMAAANHAAYLLETRNTGHLQEENPAMRTPQQRILHFGGDYDITAENVIQSFLFIPVGSFHRGRQITKLEDYDEAAKELAEGWRNSPGHYHNIILPEVNVTGIAVSYDPYSHQVFAVQTFGRSNNPPKLQKQKVAAPPAGDSNYGGFSPSPVHRRHAWRIKEPPEDYNMRRYNRLNERFLQGNLYKFTWNDSIFISHPRPYYLRQLFRDRKDGLALEFVPQSHYLDSSTYYTRPARRNGACIFNGIVPRPVYKKVILDSLTNYRRHRRNKEPFLLFLATVPEKLRGTNYETNLLVLKDNYLVDIKHFISFPGKPLPITPKVEKIPYQFEVRDVEYTAEPDYDTLYYKVFFEPNQTHPPDTIIQKIREMVHIPGYHPYYGIITAFASVEGPEAHNNELHPERASFLSDLMQEEYPDSFPLYIHSKENWGMFRTQIKNTRYAFLADTSIEVARRVLRFDQAKKDLDQALDQQRFVNLYIIYEEEVTDLVRVNGAIEEFNRKVKEIQEDMERHRFRKRQPASKLVNYLSDLEHYIFSHMLKGTIPISRGKEMKFVFNENKKDNDPFIKETLFRDWISFRISYDKNVGYTFRTHGYLFINIHEGHPVERLNYYIMSANPKAQDKPIMPMAINSASLISLNNLLNEFENKDEYPAIRKMWNYYHMERLNYAREKSFIINPDNYRNNAEYVFKHYREFEFTEDIENYKYRIALLLAHVEAFDLSLQLLEELYLEGTNKAAIRDYLVMYYNTSLQKGKKPLNLFFEVEDKLSDEEWCNLFAGYPRISFQMLDNQDLREYYCKKCQE